LSKEWLRRRRRDYFYRKAKEESYRSRASFKLLQAVKKYNFIKLGDVVVDLGASPGGWLQVAREIVGDKGFVLGLDLVKIKPLGFPNVYIIVGDVKDPEITRRIKAVLPRLADVVLSDVSPNISGVWEVDHARQIELAECSLQIAVSILGPKGYFFVKVFMGEMFNSYLNQVKKYFSSVRVFKPKASRAESAEIYVLALEYKG